MKIAGDSTVTEMLPSRRFTESGGWIKIRTWEGFISDLESLAVQLQADGYADIVISPEGDAPGTGELSATLNRIDEGATEDPDFDVWELQANDLEVSPDNSPYFKDSTLNPHNAVLYDVLIAMTKAAVNAGSSLSYSPLTVSAQQILLGQELYDLLSGGANLLEGELVLRLTRTISSLSATSVSPDNILRRIQASTIVALEEIPAFDVAAMELPTTGEWLKKQPNRVKVERGKWQITQEWWHSPGGFDFKLYPKTNGDYSAY
jgi:hypothetical protein